MRAYYERHGVTLLHGDAREIVPGLGLVPARTVVITDPPWPNMPAHLAGAYGTDDPRELRRQVAAVLPVVARRVVVVLGCDSNPAVLAALPASMPFVRACWLRHAIPSHRGTILAGSDVAYAYGDHRAPKGNTVIPGEVTQNTPGGRDPHRTGHPTPRRIEHMRWLVRWFTEPEDTVLDPFAGSGTTLQAAREQGRRAVGIEISEDFCAGAVRRFAQEPMFPPEAP